jgi:hypothetical protein
MKHAPKALTAGAVALAVAAAIATVVSLPSRANRFDLTWGSEMYVLAPLPYVALVILGFAFGRTVPGATISLVGTLVLSGFGVYWSYGAEDAISVVLLPFTLLAGCGVLLLVQLIRRAVMRGARPRA